MKLYKSIILSLACVTAFTSCEDWLDVNVNPNTPTDLSATYEKRLAHIEFYTNSAYGFSGMRTNQGLGDWTQSSRTNTYGAYAQWNITNGPTTTPYQWWFVGAACNLDQAFKSAEAAGATHYLGAFHFIKAYGFMLMTDLYGEMPYNEAIGESAIPKFDNGKTIYAGCLAEIDKAIECFQTPQKAGAEPLTIGDSWNNGDVDKWLKAAYLMKARWINKLIKKGEGSYKDLKWDSAEILKCLENAQKSNADNTVMNHVDAPVITKDVLGWNEPVDYNPRYSVIGMNSNYYVTKMFVDNFTNFAGLGVEDPRADHVIPWARSQKTANSPEGLVWSENGKWRRSVGLDMNTLIRTEGAPYSTSWDQEKSCFYCDNEKRLGDTIYIQETSSSKNYAQNRSLFYYRDRNKMVEHSAMSGVFHSRVSSPSYIATYHEACFIKAEVLMRKGDKAGAFAAYKEGIKANIEVMNDRIIRWGREDANLLDCPSFVPMEQEDIDNYLEKGIGTAGDITLGKIMTQKRMAMILDVEQWNDMRRYDFSEEIFLNWHIPAEYYVNEASQRCIPMGKQLRRWRQCSHERNYNATNLQAIGAEVPGAVMGDELPWNEQPDVWSINVWWDSDQQ